MATLQSDLAINYANQIISLVQQMRNLRTTAAEIQAINTNTPLGNLWNVLSTTALSADGGLGAPNASPNTANPIDTRVYPTLTRGQVSANTLANGLALVISFVNLMNGQAITANGATPATVNTLSM